VGKPSTIRTEIEASDGLGDGTSDRIGARPPLFRRGTAVIREQTAAFIRWHNPLDQRIRCRATRLTNSRGLMIFVFFQNGGTYLRLPVTR
jgi:hypothetical protein